MQTDKDRKRAIAAAAERVAQNSNTEITEVIEPENPPENDNALYDRIAAAAAAFVVCGACYFAIWLWVFFELESKLQGGLDIFLSWRAPAVATVVTTVSAFFRPKWTYRIFGEIMKS